MIKDRSLNPFGARSTLSPTTTSPTPGIASGAGHDAAGRGATSKAPAAALESRRLAAANLIAHKTGNAMGGAFVQGNPRRLSDVLGVQQRPSKEKTTEQSEAKPHSDELQNKSPA